MLKKSNIKLYIAISKNHTDKGGGFNFLNYLIFKLKNEKLIVNKLYKSNIILINSHHNFLKIFLYKYFFPKKIFIHRIDGPISKYAGKNDYRDYLVKIINFYIADATIFQSRWSFNNKNFKHTNEFKIIKNTADKRFYKYKKVKKIKNSIIICSWSSNMNKGFKLYSFLDSKLDFKKFNVTFVGNSPIRFKNIKIHKPLNPNPLSKLMLKHQIYLTASKNDPCSNSLLEALELRLPSLVLKSGGHPEIINDKGIQFSNRRDLILKIDTLSKNYQTFRKRFKKKETDITEKYSSYFQFILNKLSNNNLTVKKINIFVLMRVIILYLSIKIIFKFKKNYESCNTCGWIWNKNSRS